MCQDLRSRGAQLDQLRRELGQHDAGGTGAGHDHGLLVQGGEDLGGPAFTGPRSELGHERGDPGLPGPAQRLGRGVFSQQFGHHGVVQVRADDPFQGGVDLGEEPADPVRGGGGLLGQVVIETAEHRQFGGLLVGDGRPRAECAAWRAPWPR